MEYSIARLNRLLDSIKDRAITPTSAQDAFLEFLHDKDFMTMLYNPTALNLDPAELRDPTMEMYAKLNRPRVLKILTDAIMYEGYDRFDRNTAAWLHTIALGGIKAVKDRTRRLEDDIVDDRLTRREIEEEKETIAKLSNCISKVIHTAMKIVKSRAKVVARQTGLSRDLVQAVLIIVPEPDMINVYQVGHYTSQVLTTIYSNTEGLTSTSYSDPVYFNDFSRRPSDIDWEPLFEELFGEKNVVEAATFILLEGMNKLDAYKNPKVKDIWDSITKFALSQLDKVPRMIQNQMLDLYLKRITKMFRNKTFDLRVDLRQLDKYDLPHLVETIKDGGYDKKISEIIHDIASGAQ